MVAIPSPFFRAPNYYVEQAISPEGSERLQMLISGGVQVDEIFSGIIGSIIIVMGDEHGHCVVSKLIPFLEKNQMAMIAKSLITKYKVIEMPIALLSCNIYASWLLQRRLMKHLVRHNLAVLVIPALVSRFCGLMKHKTARNVVVKCAELISPAQAEPLYRACIQHWVELATHSTGCHSLNHFIEHVKGPLRVELLNRITDHTMFLAQHHPTGNHVLQKLLDLQDESLTEKICRGIRREYVSLALRKDGRYLVEKCLDSSGWVYALDDLVFDEAQLVRIAKNKYGGYVVKKALQVSKFRSSIHHYLQLVKTLNNNNLLRLQLGYGDNIVPLMINLKIMF